MTNGDSASSAQSAIGATEGAGAGAGDSAVHRYCGFVHVKVLDDAHCLPLEEWLQERFTEFQVMARETAQSGPHIQFYVEGSEWTKADSNRFSKTGVFGKFMPDKMAKAKAKRWSKQTAKKDRETNCKYVSKGGIVQYMSHGDPGEYVGRWQYQKHKYGRETFQEKIERIWIEAGKPMHHREIFRALVKSKAVPWNNMSGELLWKAADWLLNQADEDASEERMMREYDNISERKNRF